MSIGYHLVWSSESPGYIGRGLTAGQVLDTHLTIGKIQERPRNHDFARMLVSLALLQNVPHRNQQSARQSHHHFRRADAGGQVAELFFSVRVEGDGRLRFLKSLGTH